MTVRQQLRSYTALFPMLRKSGSLDLMSWLRHRPQLLVGIFAYETALATSGRMDPRLKSLATLKAAALVNCEFCLDIGSTMAKMTGVTEAQLVALPHYREADVFDADETLVLEFAEAISKTPALVPKDLRDRLVDRFGAAAVAELSAAVAWENSRGRLNQALGARPAGFSAGGACAIAEHPTS
ncbi:MAG: carboxymuconolactone decarboxylase family protein [Acidimicrobiales bacterium]